jgi:hypothetical protein
MKETFLMENLTVTEDHFSGPTAHSTRGHGKMAFSTALVFFESQMLESITQFIKKDMLQELVSFGMLITRKHSTRWMA